MSQAQHLTGHISRLEGQIHGRWETSLGGPSGRGQDSHKGDGESQAYNMRDYSGQRHFKKT